MSTGITYLTYHFLKTMLKREYVVQFLGCHSAQDVKRVFWNKAKEEITNERAFAIGAKMIQWDYVWQCITERLNEISLSK